MVRRKPALPHDYRVERWSRSMIPGTDAGTVELAKLPETNASHHAVLGFGSIPYSAPAHLGLGQLIAMQGTVTAPAGGGGVTSGLDVMQDKIGFAATAAAGSPVVIPLSGAWLLEIDLRFTDGYRDGAELVVTRNGTPVPTPWPPEGPWSEWVGTLAFAAVADEVVDLVVTPEDGSSHTAELTFRLTFVEPLGAVIPNGIYTVIGGEIVLFEPVERSWFNIGSPREEFSVTVGHQGPNNTMCAADSGSGDARIWRTILLAPTEDDWTEVYAPGHAVAWMETDNAGAWCAIAPISSGSSEIYRSTDDGLTWSVAATLSTADGSAAPDRIGCDRQGTWLASCTVNGNDEVWYSTDAGASWTMWNLQGKVPDNQGQAAILGGNVAVGQTPFGGLWESTDLTDFQHEYPCNSTYGPPHVSRTTDAHFFAHEHTTDPCRYWIVAPDGAGIVLDTTFPAGFSQEAGSNAWTHDRDGRMYAHNDVPPYGLAMSEDDAVSWELVPGPAIGDSRITHMWAYHAT